MRESAPVVYEEYRPPIPTSSIPSNVNEFYKTYNGLYKLDSNSQYQGHSNNIVNGYRNSSGHNATMNMNGLPVDGLHANGTGHHDHGSEYRPPLPSCPPPPILRNGQPAPVPQFTMRHKSVPNRHSDNKTHSSNGVPYSNDQLVLASKLPSGHVIVPHNRPTPDGHNRLSRTDAKRQEIKQNSTHKTRSLNFLRPFDKTQSLLVQDYDGSPRHSQSSVRPVSQYQSVLDNRNGLTNRQYGSMHVVNTQQAGSPKPSSLESPGPIINVKASGSGVGSGSGGGGGSGSGVRNAINKASQGGEAILKRLRFGGSREKSTTIDEDGVSDGVHLSLANDLTHLAPPGGIQATGWSSVPQTAHTIHRSTSMSDTRPPAPHAVACHDCSSVASIWGLNKRCSNLDPPRLTGASQAQSPTEDDTGDARSNHMLHSCPAFRNELGGEMIRRVALCRLNEAVNQATTSTQTWHREVTAADAGVLENLSNIYMGARLCASRQAQVLIEPIDPGAYFYRHCFSGRSHHNYLGTDDNLGPVAVSVLRENLAPAEAHEASLTSNGLYRLVIRISDQLPIRATVLEDAVMDPTEYATATSKNSGRVPLRELLELVCPQLQISCLKLAVPVPRTEELLMNVDEQPIYTKYKIGVLLCKAGQSTEEEMYNNEFSTPALDEFLDMLGSRVRLKGFTEYKGGLDTRGDTTGTHSVFSTIQQHSVMFHVSTMLPFTATNKQQLSRKRHIGNDMVTIIFQEPGAKPFSALTVRSHFQHVFVVVQANNPCTENVTYNVAVSRAKDVPPFGPIIPVNATFAKSNEFRDFLLTKVINAENAVHRSVKFAAMSARTQREMLKGFVENNTTQHPAIEPSRLAARLLGGQGRSSRRSAGIAKVCMSECVRGALSWGNATVEDHSQNGAQVGVVIGLSADNLVLISIDDGNVIFATPTHSIIGWQSKTNKINVFYEHASMLTLRMVDVNETQLLIQRLIAVTKGCEAQELTIRPNQNDRHDFHIQEEGIVVDVSMYSSSWACGLRQGSRLVMIAGVPITTMTPQQMQDSLHTSQPIRALVIAPSTDGAPRRGCEDPHCPAAFGKSEKTRTPPTYSQVQAQRRQTTPATINTTNQTRDLGYESATWTSTMNSNDQVLERRKTMPECSHQPVDTLSSSGSDEASSSLSGAVPSGVKHTTLADVKRGRLNRDLKNDTHSEPDVERTLDALSKSSHHNPPIPPRTYRGAPIIGHNRTTDNSADYGSHMDRTHSVECISAEPNDPAPNSGLDWNSHVVEAAKVLANNPAQGSCQLRLQAALQRVKALEGQLERLTIDLANERTQRQDLESQVSVLREENTRLGSEKQRVESELQRLGSDSLTTRIELL